MSNLKLHLPYYNITILNKIISVMNTIENIIVLNTKDFFNENKKKIYNKICKYIFSHQKYIIILLGEFDYYELPIPDDSKFLLKEFQKHKKKYPKYQILTEQHLLRDFKDILYTSVWNNYGFSLLTKNKKPICYNIYHILYLTNFNKVYELKLEYLIKKLYGNLNFEELELWDRMDGKDGGVGIHNLKTDKGHYNRVKNTNLNFPIILYKKNKKFYLFDGRHRLIKYYINKINKIKVIFITENQLKKAISVEPNKGTECIMKDNY